MLLTIDQFIAKAKLALPDVLYGLPGAHRMHFLPVMAYPKGVFVSSSIFVEDRISRDGKEKTPPAPTAYAEERKIMNVDFACSQSGGTGATMNSLFWALAQENGGYTLLSRSSEWEYSHDEAETTISAYALYLRRMGVDQTDTSPIVDTFLKLKNYPALDFIRASAMKFSKVGDQVAVDGMEDLIERLKAFCEAPRWSERGTRPYADLERLSGSFTRFLRRYVDEPVLENIDEAIATGMPAVEALERAGQALKTHAFRVDDKFSAIECMANEYSGQSLIDADVPPSPEQLAIFLAAIERAAETGFSVVRTNINLANRRIAKLKQYEKLIESKASRLQDGEITFAEAMETLRQVVNLERAANDNPEGQDAAELIDAATSFKVALALARRFAQEVHEEIVADFEASLPDIHALLAAIRSSDFPADLEVEQRIENDGAAHGIK
ncbi:hypothetical protein [Rhizobium sp. MHM7A]|uniref:hypothetical protein n=1 Tax=Rhizobium sp. MHM7A TaxID=2583233 RepID=UPI0011074D74|nr:hypothetical protein [Rhizobium sp. MHM7A]TLX16443.1 hypothetical protein FFR93_03660 [Rhizobium sp. MHM7A]